MTQHTRPACRAATAGIVAALCMTSAAHADVVISSGATSNVTCTSGICTPSAPDAVLNVGDLETLLASGNVKLAAAGEPVDVDIAAPLSWVSTNTLTLDSYHSISVQQPVAINGGGGLALITNDGGTDGQFAFLPGANVAFLNGAGSLAINGTAYTLVNDIATLADAIRHKPVGYYALSGNYDASRDGTYRSSPVATEFKGAFDGLGNAISNLSIVGISKPNLGLFSKALNASLQHIGLLNARISSSLLNPGNVGALAGEVKNGVVDQAYVTGAVSGRSQAYVGGLIGSTTSVSISKSYSNATVSVSGGDSSVVGGLVGMSNSGDSISLCYAIGPVSAGPRTAVGGLAGETAGTISTSYATGSVTGGKTSSVGGLVGGNSGMLLNTYASGSVSSPFIEGGLVGGNNAYIAQSYSFGVVSGHATDAGGSVGLDHSQAGAITDDFWDTTTSGITNLSQGAGSPANDPGITGETTAQLQSALPTGFDPTIWAESPSINNGLPYLINNPPQ
jgi:hypothetical protein